MRWCDTTATDICMHVSKHVLWWFACLLYICLSHMHTFLPSVLVSYECVLCAHMNYRGLNCRTKICRFSCGWYNYPIAMKGVIGAPLLVFLLATSCVYLWGKQVICAVKQAEKTGTYIAKVCQETSHDNFKQTLQKALHFSEDPTIYVKHDWVFKFFTMRLSEQAVDEVDLAESFQPCSLHAVKDITSTLDNELQLTNKILFQVFLMILPITLFPGLIDAIMTKYLRLKLVTGMLTV